MTSFNTFFKCCGFTIVLLGASASAASANLRTVEMGTPQVRDLIAPFKTLKVEKPITSAPLLREADTIDTIRQYAAASEAKS